MTHKILLTLFILLIPSVVFADLDSIQVSIYEVPGASGDDFLAAPRQQILPQDGRDTIVLLVQGSSAPILRSFDGGANFSDTIDATEDGNDHQHGFILNDTVYYSNRNASYTDSMTFTAIDVDGGNSTIFYDQINVGFGIDCNYSGAVASFVRLGDLLIGTARGYDCNYRYVITEDFFSTQTTGYVDDYSAAVGGTDTRMGLHSLPFDGGRTVWMSGWISYSGSDTVDLWEFDPSDSSWTRETNAPLEHNDLHRYYAFNTFHDTALMVAAFEWNGEDTCYTAWRGKGSNTWNEVKAVENLSATSDRPQVGLIYVDSIETLVLVYLWDGGLYMKYWKDNFTWSDEYTLVSPDSSLNHPDIAIAYNVPSSHGPKVYVVNKNANATYFTSVRLFKAEEGLQQTWLTIDTTATTVDFEASYTGESGTVDFVKVIYGTVNDITDANRDSVQQTTNLGTPDTLEATGLSPSTEYYYWGVIQDDNGPDTSDVDSITTDAGTHTWSAIDSTTTTFDVEVVFPNFDANQIDEFKLIFGAVNDITDGGRDSTTKAADFGSPDTLQATGLTQNTKYYWWGVLTSGSWVDTSDVDSTNTLEAGDPLDDVQGPSKIEGFIIVQ